MKLMDYMKPSVMNSLEPTTQKFVAKMIIREAKRIAKENNMTEEQAYYWMSKGLYGGDREIDFLS